MNEETHAHQTKALRELAEGYKTQAESMKIDMNMWHDLAEKNKVDAERYRWFRENMASGHDPYTCEWVTKEEHLDKYIDEEMKKEITGK